MASRILTAVSILSSTSSNLLFLGTFTVKTLLVYKTCKAFWTFVLCSFVFSAMLRKSYSSPMTLRSRGHTLECATQSWLDHWVETYQGPQVTCLLVGHVVLENILDLRDSDHGVSNQSHFGSPFSPALDYRLHVLSHSCFKAGHCFQ